MAELHTVGSPPILEAVLAELLRHGTRLAKPGEFTLRAFLSGRIDLVQAEAVLGVIDASQQAQLQRALEQLAGGISGHIAEVHSLLLDLLSDLEAGLDFVDEDIEFISPDEVHRRLESAGNTIQTLLKQSTDRMATSTRARVVIAGLPNAGKSTLFNAVVGAEAALVSEEHGTTRDYLRAELDWQGVGIELVDTAGWEQLREGIAGVAQQLRDDQLQRSDLVVWCTAADHDNRQSAEDDRLFAAVKHSGRPVLRILTKCDFGNNGRENDDSDAHPAQQNAADAPFLSVSAFTGRGLAELQDAVVESLSAGPADAGGLVGTTAARCRGSLQSAADGMQRAREAANAQLGDDLVAAELRDVLNHLGEIVGTVYTDDILDRIFSKFCIGK